MLIGYMAMRHGNDIQLPIRDSSSETRFQTEVRIAMLAVYNVVFLHVNYSAGLRGHRDPYAGRGL